MRYTVQTNMAKYKKIEIAINHFNTAVKAYREGDLLTALHCAGAAEEMAGALCAIQEQKNALEELAVLQSKLGLGLSNRDLQNHLRSSRNEIKHSDRDPDAIVEIIGTDCLVALLMSGLNIMRTEHKKCQSISESLKSLNKMRVTPSALEQP